MYPNTATLSFRAARFRSAELTLRTTELTDNVGRPLQAETRWTPASSTPMTSPLTSTAPTSPEPSRSSTSEITTSWPAAQYTPQLLAGLSAAQIARQLSNPASPVAKAIDGSARVIIVAIDQVLQDKTAPS